MGHGFLTFPSPECECVLAGRLSDVQSRRCSSPCAGSLCFPHLPALSVSSGPGGWRRRFFDSRISTFHIYCSVYKCFKIVLDYCDLVRKCFQYQTIGSRYESYYLFIFNVVKQSFGLFF